MNEVDKETQAGSAVEGWLPQWATSCVGRDELLARAQEQLREVRLLTFTGGAGIGKTTLALEIARTIQRGVVDGTWWVSLGAVAEPTLLAQEIASVLGVQDHSAQPAEDVLVAHLQDLDDVVLVLDTCEHMIVHVARLVDTLLQRAPGVRVIATSRQPLDVGAEHLLSVPPLVVPDADHRAGSLKDLSEVPSVRLLCERAAAVAPEFELNDTTREAVAELVRRVNGLPLAIEIAAARLRCLSPKEIVLRSNELFNVLTNGGPVVPTHHGTLWDTVAWSYRLCTADERTMWARVSVFADGFDLAAAEAVCAGEEIGVERVADLLSGLVDASVVVRYTDREGSSRFGLIETMRQFGAERLRATGDEPQLRHLHVQYYAALVADVAAGWFSPRELGLLLGLGREMHNVRVAMRNAVNDRDLLVDGVRMAIGLVESRVPNLWGPLSEGYHWLDLMLRSPHPMTAALRATATDMAAWILIIMGEPEKANRLLRMVISRPADPAHDFVTGAAGLFGRRDPAAIPLLQAAHKGFTSVGRHGSAHMSLLMLSFAVSVLGTDPAVARRTAARCLEDAERAGAPWATSWATWSVGLAELLHGSPRRALHRFRAALRMQRCIARDRWGAPWSGHGVAWALAGDLADKDKGQATEAAVMLGVCELLRKRTGVEITGMAAVAHVHEEAVRRVTEILGDDAYVLAYRCGVQLDIDSEIQNGRAWAMALGEAAIPRPESSGGPRLSLQQWRIVQLVGQGLPSKQIAAHLDLSIRTIDNTIRMIYERLEWHGQNTRTRLAAWAVENADLVAFRVGLPK